MGLEREVKLEVPAGWAPPAAVAGLALAPAGDQDLDATYHDTGDLALLAVGATLRHRTGEGEDRWTLKLPQGGPAAPGELRRRELDVTAPAGGGPPAELAARVAEVAGGRPLVPVARLRTRRRRYHLVAGGRVVAELDDDEVEGRRLPGGAPVRFREVEVEAAPGAPDGAVADVAAELRAAGAVAADPTPKLARVLGGPA